MLCVSCGVLVGVWDSYEGFCGVVVGVWDFYAVCFLCCSGWCLGLLCCVFPVV